MGYTNKVFNAGNSAAVRLPKNLAFALGTEITIERTGDTVTIRPAIDPDAALKRNQQLAEALRAAWAGAPYREVEVRDPDIFPGRPGLY